MAKSFSGRDVVKILVREYGFVVVSQKGSHIKLRQQVRKRKVTTVIPDHKELAPGTLRGALELAEIDYRDFFKSH